RGGDVVFSIWHPELVGLRATLGNPRHPVQVIATLTGLDFERGILFNVPDIKVVLITTAAVVDAPDSRRAIDAREWLSPIVMSQPSDLPWAFEQLTALGISRISCVGGRTLAGALIDAGLVQDIYLTTSPKPGGDPGTPLYPRSLPTRTIVRKHGTGAEAGVVF